MIALFLAARFRLAILIYWHIIWLKINGFDVAYA